MMECNKETKEVEYLGEHFRITYYHGSNIIKLDELVTSRWGKTSWKCVYTGHNNILQEVLDFAEEKRIKT